MKAIAGIVGGFIVACLAAFLVNMTMSVQSGARMGSIAFFLAWLVSIGIAVKSPSTGKAWRRLLVTSSIFSFLLPLSGLIFTGTYMATKTAGGAEAAGAAIGGGLVSGFLGFVGFFLGIVFLVIGLLVGRDKQVVVIHAPGGVASNTTT